MNYRTSRKMVAPLFAIMAALLLTAPAYVQAQQRGGPGGQPAPTPKAAAAIDLTGYWVSVVTEDWKFRMVTPPKGQYGGVPVTAEARRIADTWDPAKDEAAGNQCKAYGAPAIMRMPGRLHITWENDNTLRVDTDAGTQTRLLHFGAAQPPQSAETGWQGYSAAQWQYGPAVPAGQTRLGDLKVVTTRMRPGYVRKNGVPYSANAVLTETYQLIDAPNGDKWLIVITALDDPLYVNSPYLTSSNFKKVPDATGWNPTPCSAR